MSSASSDDHNYCSFLTFFLFQISFKFLRIFPLSQFDLPSSRPTLTFPDQEELINEEGQKQSTPTIDTKKQSATNTKLMTTAMEEKNPQIDYTKPDLITFIFSDVGSLRPSGVGDALLAVYGGNAD